MKVEVEKVKNKVKLKVEIPAQEFTSYYGKAASKLSKDLEIKGFRKGKAPKEKVEEALGRGRILEEASRLAIEENYKKAILKEKIEAIEHPKIKILKLAKNNPLIFEAKVAVLPEVDLPNYKKIASKVKRKEVSVSDEELEKTLAWLRKSRADLNEVSREAAKGDFVNIDFKSKKLGLEKNDAFILGEGHFIPGFEEKIEGMKAGEEKQFKLTFPKEHYQEDLRGKEVDFEVKLNAVKEVKLPEITDQWAQSLGHFNSVKALKVSLRQNLKKEKEQREEQRVRQEVLKKISEKVRLEPPQPLVSRERAKMLSNLKKSFSNKGTSFEDYLKKTNTSEEKIKESLEKQAKKRIKNFLILREIAKREEITVSDDEVEKEVNKLLEQYSKKQAEKVDPEYLKEYTKETLRNQKTLQKLASFAGKSEIRNPKS